ncbi:MAG: hypothetical protein ACOX5R_19200 [bacterium]|jgi:hypothetical protein
MLYSKKSRYANQPLQTVTDGRGRAVQIVLPAPAPSQRLRGYHILRQGERIDHLAARYLNDASGYWRIAEMNDVMMAEMLTELAEISIPDKE